MFIGRTAELALLERKYQASTFEFLVLYGRRRVGKTSLLRQFAKDKKVLFYSAQVKNDSLNLADFSTAIWRHFVGQDLGPFASYQAALEYIATMSMQTSERTVLIIDEFPFLTAANPSIKSILQHTIDHSYKERNIFLIICGSSISCMQEDVLGYNSPLYGRSTSQLELLPFDYYTSASFYPHYSSAEKLLSYGILGGIPCYLERFTDQLPLAANIAEQILAMGSFLREEPQVLLQMETREPAVYNSILEAISTGSSKLNEIASKIHEDSQKCAKYIATLKNLKLVAKVTPVGEAASSRRTLYQIADNYVRFWYHFLFRHQSYYELLGPDEAACEIMATESIANYMGPVFESICQQYLLRLARARLLPFVPEYCGKWWGTNPLTHKQDDIDILALSPDGASAIFCECKYRTNSFGKGELENLEQAAAAFPAISHKYYYLFAKGGFTPYVQAVAQHNPQVKLYTLDDLYNLPTK